MEIFGLNLSEVKTMAEYIETVSLGTLRRNDEEVALTPIPAEFWNVPELEGSIESYEIGDTSSIEENQIRWHRIQDEETTLYYADRVILSSVSYEDLMSHDLATGRKVAIDGEDYLLRILSRGEWERVILNEDEIGGLPVPDDGEDGEHNTFWQWHNMLSWSQDGEDDTRKVWGYDAPDASYDEPTDSREQDVGWRPVLESIPDGYEGSLKMSMSIEGELREFSGGWVAIDGELREFNEVWTKIDGELRRISK